MNTCYICEQPVDRAPTDGKQHFHEQCKERLRAQVNAPAAKVGMADYWNKSAAEQQALFEEIMPSLESSDCIITQSAPAPDNPCIALYGPGPKGVSCRQCVHLRYPLTRSGTKWWKCDLRKLTHGRATDHRVRWPACAKYEERTEDYQGG